MRTWARNAPAQYRKPRKRCASVVLGIGQGVHRQVLGQYRTAKWVRVDGNAEDIQAGKDVRRQMQGQYRTLERVCIGSTRHRKGCAWADTRSVQDTGKGVRRQLRGAHLAVDAKPQRDRLPLKQFTPPQKKRRQQKSTGP